MFSIKCQGLSRLSLKLKLTAIIVLQLFYHAIFHFLSQKCCNIV